MATTPDFELCPSDIRRTAQAELRYEAFRLAVDAEKARLLRRRTFWSKLFPFTLTFTRKNP